MTKNYRDEYRLLRDAVSDLKDGMEDMAPNILAPFLDRLELILGRFPHPEDIERPSAWDDEMVFKPEDQHKVQKPPHGWKEVPDPQLLREDDHEAAD